MPASDIIIKGAREHNLRDVDLVLPRNQLICLTGVSGSGKSSLAFDTLYAEGQRRYVESLSTFARQFLGQMPKPDVDHISGLSPSISIAQKSAGSNPRSTVGTITEIYDFLRVLYARVGQGHCHQCGQPITAQSREQIIARIMSQPAKTKLVVLAPIVRQQKGEFRDLCEDLLKQGFVRARVDGEIVQLTDNLALDRQMRHDIEVVVDRLVNGPSIRSRLAEAVELALKLGEGNLIVAPEDPPAKPAAKKRSGLRPGDIALSADYACNHCGISFQPPSPQLFSFNSPQGMCYECDGLGTMFSFDPEKLITDPTKSVAKGCIELVGQWKDLGRWKRHIYQGVADTMERKCGWPTATLTETPWQELTDDQQFLWLWGTGNEHITYTWRGGKNSQKYGGAFDGIIPELLEKYRGAKSKSLIAKLEKFMNVIRCPDCDGQRLNPQARSVQITSAHEDFREQASLTLPELSSLPIEEGERFFSALQLDETAQTVAAEVLKEIRGRLGFLTNVGLDYLSLDRTAPTLSGGETQRIRLAGQIGCGLVGVLYILDEPSIGLHPRDNDRLLATLQRLRDQGNTVVVVEHDEDTMRAADQIIDFGPGPGVRGGELVAVGDAEKVGKAKNSITGAYLSGKRKIQVPEQRRIDENCEIRNSESAIPSLRVVGARHNNL
ncbi:MAG: excinuclease ABC subunit UvrA, partial [Bythopirellula sp.]